MFKNPIFTFIGTTGFEVAGLILWFEFDRRGIPGGLVIMFLGLVIERIIVIGIPPSLDVWLGVIGSSWWEYAVWALWLLLIQKGANPIEVFVLILAPGIHFQHAFSTSMKFDIPFPTVVRHPWFIFFSLIEAVGAALWLAAFESTTLPGLIAPIIILVSIGAEHIVQGIALDKINAEGKLAQVSKVH